MSFQFLPAGSPVTTSFCINTGLTLTASFVPPTASLAGYALNNYGPTGSSFLTVSSSGLV